MTAHDAAIYSETERYEEQQEIAREYGRLRDEEALAATLVASAAEIVFRADPADGDPVVTFDRLRQRTANYVAARDDADAYQREHGQ